MDMTVTILDFEGPLDLLLHLIKESNISIFDIQIEVITKQYLDYITKMEEMNLSIASEYLVMAAELIEMKAATLLPRNQEENTDEYEEDPKEKLIRRLLEYEQYKNVTKNFQELEENRKELFTRPPMKQSFLSGNKEMDLDDVTLEDLAKAMEQLFQRKEEEKPIHTKITTKEYSVNVRSKEIKNLLKKKKKVEFTELFETYQRDYIVVTFLSILELAKSQELEIKQDRNFQKIYLSFKGSDTNE